jgi:hypothetical protein
MPLGYRRARAIRAEVHPLLQPPNDRAGPSDVKEKEEVAYASADLWGRLSSGTSTRPDLENGDGELEKEAGVWVAVRWPEERRLGKGKSRDLIIRVEPVQPVGCRLGVVHRRIA